MSVLSEYLKLYNEYSAKYGKRVAVLLNVGHFYECYGIDNGEEKFGNAVELSKILNIVLTRKNKKIVDNGKNNPLMLGFPCLALNKYVPVLLAEDYTVVVADQVKAGAAFRRKVTNVVSPSTYIDSNDDDDYLVLVHADKHRHIGISAISVLTGNSVVHECYSDPNDRDLPLDDALGFVKQYRPREVVLSGEVTASDLELDDVLCHRAEVTTSVRNVAYQNAVLGYAFGNDRCMLSNIERANLERSPQALLSYVMLIEFVHDHNPMLLRRMSPPELFAGSDHLVLSTSTLDQLNVTSQVRSKNTLFNVVNKCTTKAGKRLLLKRITAPSADARELVRRYDRIEEFGKLAFCGEVEHLLKKVEDVERLQRRMTVGIMTPPELAGLVSSYVAMLDLDDLLKSKKAACVEKISDGHRESMQDFIGACRHAFDMDMMPTCDADNATFNPGVFAELDGMREEFDRHRKVFDDFISDVDGARVEYLQNVGYFVTVSVVRAKKLEGRPGVVVRYNRTSARVTSSQLDAASKNMVSVSEKLKPQTRKRYRRTLDFLSSYSGMFKPTTHFVASLDVVKSCYKVAALYNYCRPEVVTSGASFVDARDLRHAVIERIDDGNEYVPNDVCVGKEHNGIVLYSMNSCGKTSLLRALGLSVILAQAGCFVPASKFEIRPFKCIMTRILSRDNIMKGQSSFVAEMSELRAILKRATDGSTLVLADEITHGTEHTSGSAIFVSSVETLAQRGVNFLFTTHLHNAYPFVRDIENVRTCHLSVTFSANGTKSITFERKLIEGPGGSVYGLEVCEYLNMDADFLARAFQIRDKVTPEKDEERSTIIRVSRYNRSKIIKCCESCGYAPRLPTDQPLHTHHIKERHLADQNGMIDGVHVDSVSNLAVLCERCHRQAHAN